LSWIGLAALGALLLAAVVPAAAITNGTPSTDSRVGALAAVIPGVAEEPFFVCSGTQMSRTVFLTAAHCVAWADALPGTVFMVTFDQDAYEPGDTPFDQPTRLIHEGVELLRATGYAYGDGYDHDRGDLKDYGVVLFEGEDTLPGPWATVPHAGQLDQMKADTLLDGFVFGRVGYGSAIVYGQGAAQVVWDDGIRKETTTPYMALTNGALRTNVNAQATGMGGTGYGDSGSPVLGSAASGYQNTVFAVTSWGSGRALDAAQRLDTPDAQAFLQEHCPNCTWTAD
jgi:hypothetical protein